MILYLPTELKHKYNSKVIGYIRFRQDKYYVIGGERKQEDIPYIADNILTRSTQITLRCEKCGKVIKRTTIPKLTFLADRTGVYIELRKINPNEIWALHHCEKCENKVLDRVSAKVTCKKCKKIITRLYHQDNKGFEVKVGKTYHIEECNQCNPLIKDELVEYKQFQEKACEN